jgi:hypothetical protein
LEAIYTNAKDGMDITMPYKEFDTREEAIAFASKKFGQCWKEYVEGKRDSLNLKIMDVDE